MKKSILSVMTVLLLSSTVSVTYAEDLKVKTISTPSATEKNNEKLATKIQLYGYWAGTVSAYNDLNKKLMKDAKNLDKKYDFSHFVFKHGDLMLSYPVMVEEKVNGEITNIETKSSSFIERIPTWKSYLITDTSKFIEPFHSDEIKDIDKKLWEDNSKIGWKKCEEAVENDYKNKLKQLNEDYNGMKKYATLLKEKKVEEPSIF